MNSKELRIGNYVEAEGVPAEVTAIYSNDEDEIKVRTPDGRIIEIKTRDALPIALTDELLVRNCGFDPYLRYTIGIDRYLYFLALMDKYMVLLNQENEAVMHFWDVRSLHQLQNLYFALKGKEIKVGFNN